MKIGVIIKYYRKQKGWTQKDLGSGICSEAHLGKIEKGTTKFSTATIDLLCERLGIQEKIEIERFKSLKSQLHELDKMIVKLQLDTVENRLNDLAENPIIYMEAFHPFFLLIRCRYALEIKNMDEFNKVLKELNENYPTLQGFEWYMKEHILGIKEAKEKKHYKALEHLIKIAGSEYPNYELYYHIAVSLLFVNNQVKALFYAIKALNYFRQTNNFKKIIDTETLMLILTQNNEIDTFDDTIQKYRDLIQMCDIYQFHERHWTLLMNFALTHFMKKDFERAQTICEEAKKLSLKMDDKAYYIASLKDQITSRLWQNKPFADKEKEKWLGLIEEGVTLSKNNKTFKIHFDLLTLLAEDEKELYYEKLYKVLIPYLMENGEFFTARFYAKESYQYFLTIGREDTAAQIAMLMMV